MGRLKEEHGAALEAKRKTEKKLRNLEARIADDKEDMEKMGRKLEKEQMENKKVREGGREGGRWFSWL